MSSQTKNSPSYTNCDWNLSVENIKNMVIEAGFSDIKTLIYNQSITGMACDGATNTFYFECVF
tara:strand:- start:395 stop:583 length:189 start_codon:yes stop_codon:yes gene_type:complete